MSPVEEAQQHFPGHQEFFFLFMQSADSYNFNLHLRNQLVHRLKCEQATYDSRKNLEARLQNMQLLARFLGYLVFSPNWSRVVSGKFSDANQCPSPPDGLHQLEAEDNDGGIQFTNLIQSAWNSGHLVYVIPWITELLKMSSWDATVTRSNRYKEILGLLKQVQELLRASLRCFKLSEFKSRAQPPGIDLVSLHLEALFGETVGLSRSASLPGCGISLAPRTRDDFNIHTDTEGSDDVLDHTNVMFDQAMVFSPSPHVEELYSLVSNLTRVSAPRKSPGASRKLRPVTISRDAGSLSSVKEPKPELGLLDSGKSTTIESSSGISSLFSLAENSSGSGSVQTKLGDAFFHQHRDLKEICEFSIHQILKKALVSIPKQVQTEIGFDGENVTEEMRASAEDKGLKLLRSSLEDGLDQSLTLLEPPETHPKIHSLAVSLAVARGYETGHSIIKASISSDLKPLQRSLFAENAKETPELLAHNSEKEAISQLTSGLTLLRKAMEDFNPEADSQDPLQKIYSVESLLDSWAKSVTIKPPTEEFLREMFEAISQLDRSSLPFIDFCLGSTDTTEKRWLLVVPFLHITAKLCRHPRRGLSRITKYLRNFGSLQRLMELGLAASSPEIVATLLMDLLEGNVIGITHLETSLIHCLLDENQVTGQQLAKTCLSILESRNTLAYRMKALQEAIST